MYIDIYTYKYTSIFGGAVACFDPCPHSYIGHCSARSCLHVSCMKQFGTLCPAHSIQNYTKWSCTYLLDQPLYCLYSCLVEGSLSNPIIIGGTRTGVCPATLDDLYLSTLYTLLGYWWTINISSKLYCWYLLVILCFIIPLYPYMILLVIHLLLFLIPLYVIRSGWLTNIADDSKPQQRYGTIKTFHKFAIGVY
jgi:hypothetical protein